LHVNGHPYRTIWWNDDIVRIIDQRMLPHEFVIEDIVTAEQMATAIRDMHVRGAPLVGVAGGCGVALAVARGGSDGRIDKVADDAAVMLKSTRPTAVNLAWAVDQVVASVHESRDGGAKLRAARTTSERLIEDEVRRSARLGEVGAPLIEKIGAEKGGEPVNILTHCNAGWLATVDIGLATAPIYTAFDRGVLIHVWVDETRPRNQGARLTAWELGGHGVPHTVIADNLAGHLMQRGDVDVVIVGTDRTTWRGDVVNKVGTYQKALAALDNGVPFYVAVPSSSIDWTTGDGRDVPIESRGADEVRFVRGTSNGATIDVLVPPADSPAANYAFDVTPSRLVTGLITERGICAASESGIAELFPEMRQTA